MAIRSKRLLLQSIEEDCMIKSKYYNASTGETCAIGGIAKAAGFDVTVFAYSFQNQQNINSNPSNVTEKEIGLLRKMRVAISKKFGLTNLQMERIQDHNDGFDDVENRRRAIKEYILTQS